MSIDSLTKRAEYLKQQLQEASDKATNLSNQLQQATINMHTISGHLNEITYLLNEAKKEAPDVEIEHNAEEQIIQE
jgi:septation ring formation regulator EzrA